MDGDLHRRLGTYLRNERRRRGLSQEAFAEFLGLHRTYIGSLERSERNVTLLTIEHLADRLGVEPITLLATAPSTPKA